MTKYSAEELEKNFQQAAGIRKGKSEYAKDAGYWDGGACNWGANHNLKEDCETLSKAFNKMEGLREIKSQLKACTSKQEYDAKRANYIRKCEESINGLQIQTNSNSSMFGICIIWSDTLMSKNIESKTKVCRDGITKLKGDLERETYKWVQEIKSLQLEENQIVKKMEENKRKASDKNIDPAEKALLMQLIEEDGKKLKSNLEKQKEINGKFNFNPSEKVDDLLKKMKEAIEKGSKPKSGNKNNRNRTDPNNSDSDDENDSEDDEDNNNPLPTNPEKDNNQSTNWLQENQQLLLISSVLLVIFYLYSNNEEEDLSTNEYNYYDY